MSAALPLLPSCYAQSRTVVSDFGGRVFGSHYSNHVRLAERVGLVVPRQHQVVEVLHHTQKDKPSSHISLDALTLCVPAQPFSLAGLAGTQETGGRDDLGHRMNDCNGDIRPPLKCRNTQTTNLLRRRWGGVAAGSGAADRSKVVSVAPTASEDG
jgi:hypothetical protein